MNPLGFCWYTLYLSGVLLLSCFSVTCKNTEVGISRTLVSAMRAWYLPAQLLALQVFLYLLLSLLLSLTMRV